MLQGCFAEAIDDFMNEQHSVIACSLQVARQLGSLWIPVLFGGVSTGIRITNLSYLGSLVSKNAQWLMVLLQPVGCGALVFLLCCWDQKLAI